MSAEASTTPSSTPIVYTRPDVVRPRFCSGCKKFTNYLGESKSSGNNGRFFYYCKACKEAEKLGLFGTTVVTAKNIKEGQKIGDIVNKQAPWLGFADVPDFVYKTNRTKEADFFNTPRNKNYGRHWADGINAEQTVEHAIWLYEVNEAGKAKKQPPPYPTVTTPLEDNPQTVYPLSVPSSSTSPSSSSSSPPSTATRESLLLPSATTEEIKRYIDTRLKEFEERFISDSATIAKAVVDALQQQQNGNNNVVVSTTTSTNPLFDLGVPTTTILQPTRNAQGKRKLAEVQTEPHDRVDKKPNASDDVSSSTRLAQRPVEHLRPQKSLGVGLNEDQFVNQWLTPAEEELY